MDNITKLKLRLLENKTWPLKYMFKFIILNTGGKVDKVKNVMPAQGKLVFKHTNNLKYVSITCVADMPNADSIINIIIKATAIDGVIAL